jgi:hypothetical protein
LYLSIFPALAACRVKAIFVEPLTDVPETAVLSTGGRFMEIGLPQRNLSDAVVMPAGGLVVAVLADKPDEIPAAAPRFRIPEAWTDCILLFFHDSGNTVFPARVIPVNASSADFPLGHTVIFNVSAASVMAKLGREIVHVKPGQTVSVKPPRSGSGDFPIAIDCAYPGDKQPTALCRSTWQHEANARQILFVTPQPERKVPRVWGILDREEQAPTAAR